MGLAPAIDHLPDRVAPGRVGLLTNGAARDRRGTTSARLFADDPAIDLRCLFTPEHGFDLAAGPGEAVTDKPEDGIPIVTLYGARWAPEPEHFSGIDLLVIDLPGLGVRCFTYLATALLSLRVAAKAGCPVLVLDRPNVLGRIIEAPGGTVRESGLLCPMAIPLRHGMTLAEALSLAAAEEGLPPPAIVPCAPGHDGQPWWPPSPNLPALESALAYPGTVLIEGTSLSEGRGTDAPFRKIGAPGLPGAALADHLLGLGLPGMSIKPVEFEPTSSKHAGILCSGMEITVTNLETARPVSLVLHLLAWVRDAMPGLLAPADLLDALAGGPDLRAWCGETKSPVERLTANWHTAAQAFAERRAPFLLYES